MKSQSEQLLDLIWSHITAMTLADSDPRYIDGMKSVRWLVYNFFNAPKKDDIEDAGTKDF